MRYSVYKSIFVLNYLSVPHIVKISNKTFKFKGLGIMQMFMTTLIWGFYALRPWDQKWKRKYICKQF